MKIVYCIEGIYNAGGKERIMLKKANYLADIYDYEVFIITTEQKNRESFFKISDRIKVLDLDINYCDIKGNLISKFFQMKRKYKKHIFNFKKVLKEINPDVVITLGGKEMYFLPKIKENFAIIREHHYNKKFREFSNNTGTLSKLYTKIKDKFEESLVNKYDEFIVLTEEDRKQWNNDKVKVINNFHSNKVDSEITDYKNKKIITVGRLEHQKGYDILIEIWNKVEKKYSDWQLEIYGDGSKFKELDTKIKDYNLKNIFLRGSTKNIEEKYMQASIYIMTSRYEGMPMVLLEAMDKGLSIISFDCKCGPRDIIEKYKNGILVPSFDVDKMVAGLEELINFEEKRKIFGQNSKKAICDFLEDEIMKKWKSLLEKYERNKNNVY